MVLRRQLSVHSGSGSVLVLFVYFIETISSQTMIITRVARDLDCSVFIIFIVLCDIAHALFLELLACKKPPCNGVDAE
jgi:hypothetical protein